jgi:hypothetical protein
MILSFIITVIALLIGLATTIIKKIYFSLYYVIKVTIKEKDPLGTMWNDLKMQPMTMLTVAIVVFGTFATFYGFFGNTNDIASTDIPYTKAEQKGNKIYDKLALSVEKVYPYIECKEKAYKERAYKYDNNRINFIQRLYKKIYFTNRYIRRVRKRHEFRAEYLEKKAEKNLLTKADK